MIELSNASKSFGSWGLNNAGCSVARNKKERRCHHDTRKYGKGSLGNPEGLGRQGQSRGTIVQDHERWPLLRMDRVQNWGRPRHVVRLTKLHRPGLVGAVSNGGVWLDGQEGANG